MLILIYVFLALSVISGVLYDWLRARHKQWRQQLEPNFRSPNFCRKTGREIAGIILDANQLSELPVLKGLNSKNNVFTSKFGKHGALYLNPEHYDNQSLCALAVAAHECGHAINFNLNKKLSFLTIAIYPYLSMFIFTVSALFMLPFTRKSIGVFLLSALPGLFSVAFTFLEESRANDKGMKMLQINNLIIEQEKPFVRAYLKSILLGYIKNFFHYIWLWNLTMLVFIFANLILEFYNRL